MNGVVYARVSTEEQVSNFSLDSQESECRKYCSRMNINVVRVFREEGVSAKTVNGRPQLLDLIKFCQKKKNNITKVIVYKYDRWSRNAAEGLGVKALLAREGIEVISATEPSENNAMGKAMASMMLVWAELDNNIKSERTIDGMKSAFNQGHWPWKAPIGYAHKIVNNQKKLILLPGFKDILSRLFRNAATGLYTRTELADMLNKDGYEQLFGSPANR